MGNFNPKLPYSPNRISVYFSITSLFKSGIVVNQMKDEYQQFSQLPKEKQEAITECLNQLKEIKTKITCLLGIQIASVLFCWVPLCTCFRTQGINFEKDIQNWLDESNSRLQKLNMSVVRRRIVIVKGKSQKEFNWIEFLLTEDEIKYGVDDALRDRSTQCCCCCIYQISRVPQQYQQQQLVDNENSNLE